MSGAISGSFFSAAPAYRVSHAGYRLVLKGKGQLDCPSFGIASGRICRLERPSGARLATNRQRFGAMMRTQGVAMLIRSEMSGVHGGAAEAVRSEAIPAASLSTLLLGGLLLLIGP
jgi:hypothetical protein